MNLMAVTMFLIGLGIGGIIGLVFMQKTIKDIRDNELDNFEFIKNWAKITDDQYNGLRDYVGGVVDLLKQQVDILIDTDTTLTDVAKEMVVAVDNTIQKKLDAFTSSRLDCYDVLREDIDSMQTTSDNRWELIRDYIQDKPITESDNWYSYLQELLLFVHNDKADVTIRSFEEFGKVMIEMCYNGLSAQTTIDLETESRSEIGLDAVFMNKIDELYYILKEANKNESENVEEKAGTSEGGDAGHQEAEQDAVLSGSPDGELVQSELAENRVGDPSETEESQELGDVTYDYDQH